VSSPPKRTRAKGSSRKMPVAPTTVAPVTPGTTVDPAVFLAERIGEYGIMGTNNRVPNSSHVPLPPPTYEFTKASHFRFGYDDGEWNRRPNDSALYWVDFGTSRRPPESFKEELRRALSEVFERHGKVTISNSGNFLSRALVHEAKSLGADFEQVTVEVEGFGVPEHDRSAPHRVAKVSLADFADFAERFSKLADTSDPWLAFEAYHGEVSTRPHLYTVARTHLVHANFDGHATRVVGPPIWTVSDHEQATGINRWLLATQKVGIPQILFWSPELLVSQLASPTWRERMRRASLDPPELAPGDVRWNAFALMKATYPDVTMAATGDAARGSKRLTEPFSRIQPRLAKYGHNATHFFALHRFLERLGAKPDLFDLGRAAKDGPPGKVYFGDVHV
jgi:hypothetical protein